MKITRAALRQIIREQTDEDHAEKPEDVETVEGAWGGGENLNHDLDHSKISTGESNIAAPEVLELVVAEVRRRLREEAKTTKKYDDSKHLKGDQDELPDQLQKGIIDKALEEVDGADHDGSMMDLEDYQRLEGLLIRDLKVFLRGGYSKADVIQALTNIVNDA